MKNFKLIYNGKDITGEALFAIESGELIPYDKDGNSLKGKAYFVNADEWLDEKEVKHIERLSRKIEELSTELESDGYEAEGQVKSAAYYDASLYLDKARRILEKMLNFTATKTVEL